MSRTLYAHPVFRFVIDHNPFFLLSAVSMLVACRLLLSALALDPGQAGKLLLLVGTLNIYELLVIGIAIFLTSRPACFRDVKILLILEALFLVDVTCLNSELYSANWKAGVITNAVLLVLAMVKLLAIRRVAGIERASTFGFIMGTVALLMVTPAILAYWEHSKDGSVTAATLYGFWWLAATVPVIGAIVIPRRGNRASAGDTRNNAGDRIVRGAFVGLPFVSVVLHLWGSSWVYDAGFYVANVAPVLLGLALVAPRVVGRDLGELARIVLPPLAILLSMGHQPLGTSGAWLGYSFFSPFHLAVMGATVVYLWHAWEFRRPFIAAAVCLCGALWGLTQVPKTVWQTIMQYVEVVIDQTLALIPTTALGWGLLMIFAAFALLGIGLALCVRRRVPEPEPVSDG